EILRLSRDDPETLDDLDGYLSENIPIWKTILHKGGTSAARDSTEAKSRKIYRKCFERRFYLVNFVMDRPYKRGTRIDWKRMIAEWNKSHPSDQMNLSALKGRYQCAIKEDSLMLQVYIIRNKQELTNLWQPLEKQLRDIANNNPFSFALASLAGQKLWNDTQPLILFLTEAIRKSPMFKDIEVHNPEQAARINSELEAVVNMGDIKALVEDMGDIEFLKHSKRGKPQ
ncbi:unnamed protein product, partial [marine sediment metagenome]